MLKLATKLSDKTWRTEATMAGPVLDAKPVQDVDFISEIPIMPACSFKPKPYEVKIVESTVSFSIRINGGLKINKKSQ